VVLGEGAGVLEWCRAGSLDVHGMWIGAFNGPVRNGVAGGPSPMARLNGGTSLPQERTASGGEFGWLETSTVQPSMTACAGARRRSLPAISNTESAVGAGAAAPPGGCAWHT
jgi:hypothetical protein